MIWSCMYWHLVRHVLYIDITSRRPMIKILDERDILPLKDLGWRDLPAVALSWDDLVRFWPFPLGPAAAASVAIWCIAKLTCMSQRALTPLCKPTWLSEYGAVLISSSSKQRCPSVLYLLSLAWRVIMEVKDLDFWKFGLGSQRWSLWWRQ